MQQSITEDIYRQNYRYDPKDRNWDHTAKRVVKALLEPDNDHDDYGQIYQKAYDALSNRRLLPGGRVIANAGTEYDRATHINCLAGETSVLTSEGRKPIADLAGGEHELLTENGKWVEAPVKSFGVQNLRKVTLVRNGQERVIFATPEHDWVVTTKKSDGYEKVKTDGLREKRNWSRSASHQIRQNHSRRHTSVSPSKVGVARGFTFGDGTSGTNKRVSAQVSLVGDKDQSLEEYFQAFSRSEHEYSEGVVRFGGLPNSWKQPIPIDENSSTLYGWLAGYFAADGCVSENGEVIMDSCTREHVEHFIDVLEVLGIDHYGLKSQERISNLTNNSSTRYYVRLNPQYLRPEFFILDKHRERFNASSRELDYKWYVKSVEITGRREDVYCAVVPETHTFTLANGVLTGNCFVSGPQGKDIDSMEEIMAELTRCAKILASEGGYGFNADWMRPRGAIIGGTGARSPGAVEMLNMWDQTSETLTKGPEMEAERDDAKDKVRKGAMMVTMSLWHPDVQEFIEAKQESGRLSKFNMSVLVPDNFMQAVKQDLTWQFIYPDYEKQPKRYENEWNGSITDWEGPVKVHGSIKARELWDNIMKSTYNRNEPGIQFYDTINDRNPLYYEENIRASNPCGEQFLPTGGVCNLTNLVIPRYIQDGSLDWDQMAEDISVAVRMADNVNDITYVPLPEQRRELSEKRRIGLGHMGFGSACIMLGVDYGSDEAVTLAKDLQYFITNEAYMASARLANEKEPFPLYEEEKYTEGDMFGRLASETQEMIRRYGLRNSHLTSIQPTGNTSILAGNVSGGLEPVFMTRYTRTAEQPHLPDGLSKSGDYWEEEQQGDETVLRCTKDGYEDWQIHPTRGITKDESVVDYGILNSEYSAEDEHVRTTTQLGVQDHVRVMESFATYVDSAMSKTINIPSDYPFEDFKDLYMDMWETGVIKGGTTYRMGSMSAVLSEDESDEEEEDDETCPECGSENLSHEEGCVSCMDCSWEKCGL